MPPKGKQNETKAAKALIDKTFGMKNKKGGKAQKEIKAIQQAANMAGKNKEALAKEKQRDMEAKEKLNEQKRQQEMAELFKPVQVQKCPFGVDPKSIVCQFFKAGFCEKGKKCKFSHDLNQDRKSEKKDLYSDARATDASKETDTMETWNEERLKEVVKSKHGNPKTTTDIVCKYFIDAIEAGKYGWFWQCENEKDGLECKYVHALPPGFVLKSQKKKNEENEKSANTITIEDFLETERHKLPAKLTPVTEESFAEWKRTRLDKKEAAAQLVAKTKQATASAGKANGMSGRDLFTFNPDLYNDSEDEGDDDDFDYAKYRKETEDARDEQERQRIEALNGGVQKIDLSDGS